MNRVSLVLVVWDWNITSENFWFDPGFRDSIFPIASYLLALYRLFGITSPYCPRPIDRARYNTSVRVEIRFRLSIYPPPSEFRGALLLLVSVLPNSTSAASPVRGKQTDETAIKQKGNIDKNGNWLFFNDVFIFFFSLRSHFFLGFLRDN